MDLSSSSDAFLLIISGLVIFAAQRIISDIWIAPNVEFNKALNVIENLVQRAEELYKFSHGKNSSTSSTGKTMDQEIEELRKDLNVATWNLLGAHRSLYFLEQWWLTFRGVEVHAAKPALLTLSVQICSPTDWDSGESKAKKKIDDAARLLKLEIIDFRKWI